MEAASYIGSAVSIFSGIFNDDATSTITSDHLSDLR